MLFLNPSVDRRRRVRARHVGRAAARRLPRHLRRRARQACWRSSPSSASIASFHTIIFAHGRQIYSLSRAGYFPTGALGHARHAQDAARRHDRRRARRARRHAVVWFASAPSAGSAVIGGTLLNMAVFGAMFSYIMQALSFILLRRNLPQPRAAVPEPARQRRRGADDDHRARDDLHPAAGSGVPPACCGSPRGSRWASSISRSSAATG